MVQICPMFDYPSDHSLFSTTDSSAPVTPFNQPQFHNSASAKLYAPIQEWTSCDSHQQNRSDSIITSPTEVNGVDTTKRRDWVISASPLDFDGSAPSSSVLERYDSDRLPNPPYHFPTTGKANGSKPRAIRDRNRVRKYSLSPSAASASLSGDRKDAYSSRVPHNAVERKYREGLNAALERLRQVVPKLQQRRRGGDNAMTRLSKVMIIAGAVEYIERLESEKSLELAENQTLRRAARLGEQTRCDTLNREVYSERDHNHVCKIVYT